MTKKEIIALADVIRFSERNGTSYPWHIILQLGEFCRRHNSHFKEDRWLSYIKGECGPNGGPKHG